MASIVERIVLFVEEVASDVKMILTTKANKTELIDLANSLSDKASQADFTALQESVSGKADSLATQSALELRAMKSEVYTKAETQTEINERIQAIVGAAPENLDTLYEISAALTNNQDAAAALTQVVATKATKSDLDDTNDTVSSISQTIDTHDALIQGFGTTYLTIATASTTYATISNLNALSATLAGKEPSLSNGTTAQYFRGDKSWRNLATDVISSVMTGLSTATSRAVQATDTLIAAIGYLQAQINSHSTRIALTEMVTEDQMSFIKSGVDGFGVFTDVRHFRPDGSLYKKSILSGGTAPYYTTRTMTLYQADGTTVRATQVYNLGYTNNVLTSETLT